MKTIAELNDRNFDHTLASATTPVVVDFGFSSPPALAARLQSLLAAQPAEVRA